MTSDTGLGAGTFADFERMTEQQVELRTRRAFLLSPLPCDTDLTEDLGLADHGYWGALTCAVIAAAAGFYYYFKTILAMYTSEGTEVPALAFSGPAKAVAGALALAILILGVYPKPLQGVLTSDRPAVVAK